MRFYIRIIRTQWFFGVWWWPVPKDRAFGVCLGPVHLTWTRQTIRVR